MDTARPVTQGGIVDRGQGGRVGDEMGVVVAAEPSADGESAELGENIDCRRRLAVIVARQRKVQPGTVARGSKLDAAVDEVQSPRLERGVEGWVGADEDDISGDGGGPGCFCIFEELDLVLLATIGIGNDDGLVLGKIGSGHASPLGVGGDVRCEAGSGEIGLPTGRHGWLVDSPV